MELREFKERYIRALPEMPDGLDLRLDEFHLFDPGMGVAQSLSDNDFEHLVSVGLPMQASPFLSFGDYPDWDYGADRYFPIGADGSGSNICIDMSNGEVVLLDHDSGMKRVFLNSSLHSFLECLCIYQEALRADDFDQCLVLMFNADRKLIDVGEWWANEVKHS